MNGLSNSEREVDVQEIASCLNILRVDQLLWGGWIGAMESGAYKAGFGLLRSGDDEFDPFGVLAMVSGQDWTWDDGEDAWACCGSAMFLPAAVICDALGVARTSDMLRAGVDEWVDRLVAVVNRIADGSGRASFSDVVAVLRLGFVRAENERSRYYEASTTRRPTTWIGSSDVHAVDTRWPYYRT